jgi:hypothetical protein
LVVFIWGFEINANEKKHALLNGTAVGYAYGQGFEINGSLLRDLRSMERDLRSIGRDLRSTARDLGLTLRDLRSTVRDLRSIPQGFEINGYSF